MLNFDVSSNYLCECTFNGKSYKTNGKEGSKCPEWNEAVELYSL
jgi:hypothetical protein